MPDRNASRIPDATVSRLPVYLRSLFDLAAENITSVSSERLAEMAGVNAAKVRKDLSYLGSYGTRGVGYDVNYLLYQMNRELGLTKAWPVVIVGAGNLGVALANYGGFHERGYPLAGVVDIDPAKVGTTVAGIPVRLLDELPEVVAASGSSTIGVIATPAVAAQDAADRLVRAGVTSILNFAPVVLSVPKGVTVRKVDLAVELQILSFYQERRIVPPTPPTIDGAAASA
jgi:redox-sensing transcriptional repressor